MTERAIGFWKRRTTGVLNLCFLVAACTALSCSNDRGDQVSNTISFRLDFGGGVTLSSVDFMMTGPNGFRRTGTLPVGNDPIVTATFQNLPAGNGYNIRVKGTATDDASVCQGELTFDVTA